MMTGLLLLTMAVLAAVAGGKPWSIVLADMEAEEAHELFAHWSGRQTNKRAFLANHAYVKRRNAQLRAAGATYELDLNELWGDHPFPEDEEEEERSEAAGRPAVDSGFALLENGELDWRDKGVVGPVKNQGQCEVCYAFSATAAIESAWALETGTLVSLSEQQILDCGSSFGNGVCKGKNATGGTSETAYKYVMSQGGLESEARYPYRTYDHSHCYFAPPVAATIKDFVKVEPSGDETALQHALRDRPVSVNFDATHKDFNFYKSGVYSNPHCRHDAAQLDHEMLLVGYNITADRVASFYIVKNSWGATWGYKGFIHVAVGSNMCGIATEPTYACVNKTVC